MQIVINGQFWTEPNVGSGQYLHGLLRWLPQVAPQHHYVLLLPNRGANSVKLPSGVTPLVLRTLFDGRNANLAKLWFEQVSVSSAVWRLARGKGPTVLLTPYFAPPLRCAVPVVATVGDVIPLRLPAYRGGWHVQAYLTLVRSAAQRSAHILTFSAFSRDDVAAELGVPAERITPTLLAADERYQPGDHNAALDYVTQHYGIRAPFVYYVGGIDVRKNLPVLLRAFALVRQQHPTATLALAGRALSTRSALFPDLDRVIADLGIAQAVRRVDVSFADNPTFYQACTVFAYPSRYEGFGLPPLEAMACGAPVVTSSASSLPEVVGDAALQVAPDDVDGWAAALGRVLGDMALQADLRQQGLAQAQCFSWQRVAEETVHTLEQIDFSAAATLERA